MRKLLNLIVIALIAVMVFFPAKSNAAAKNICQTLKEEKTYYFNLDKKGKKETVKLSVSKKKHKNEYAFTYDLKTTVTVNGKNVYRKSWKGRYSDAAPVKVMVTDVNKKDKQMELLIIEGDVNDGTDGGFWCANMEHIYYYQYNNGKAKRKQDIAALFRGNFTNIFMLHGMKDDSYLTINGKDEIYARLCVEVQNFDYAHIKMRLKLKNGKFFKASTKSYNLMDIEDPFRPKKNITVYTKPGGIKKAFTVKKKESIYPCGLYTTNGKKIYLKVKNKGGKTGYIDPKKVPTFFDGTNHV
jgi:Sec-independent protein translocase protein TatA